MRGYLLDTNVVSELTKSPPSLQVTSFLTQQSELWLSVIVIHELEFGVQRMPVGQRRHKLRAFYRTFFERHEGRILPVERSVAERAAQLRVQGEREGRVLHMPDALIAGTAMVHNLILATRNFKNLPALGVEVVDPWEEL